MKKMLIGLILIGGAASAELYLGGTNSCKDSGSVTGLLSSIDIHANTLMIQSNPYVSGGYKGTPRVLHMAHLLSVTSPAGTFVNTPVTQNINGWLNGQITTDHWSMQGYMPLSTVEITVQFQCTVTSTPDLQEKPGVGSFQAFAPTS